MNYGEFSDQNEMVVGSESRFRMGKFVASTVFPRDKIHKIEFDSDMTGVETAQSLQRFSPFKWLLSLSSNAPTIK